MVYKLYAHHDPETSIEFIEKTDGLLIFASDNEDVVQLKIDKDDLFELIGGLLRIQSKLKK